VRPLKPVDAGLLSACSAIKVQREWVEKTRLDAQHVHIRHFISSVAAENQARLGRAAREHWSIENRNHHKRDDGVWQEDRHRHRRINVAQNLALTRNALLAIIPFDEKHNLPSLIAYYQERKKLAIDIIPHARPFP
jgi:predicted transposase YbfD/YdcC